MDLSPLPAALPDRLTTERLTLRAPAPKDASAMAQLANNAKIHAMTTLPFPYGEADALSFIQDFARSGTEHAYAMMLADGTLIGVAGLHLKPGSAPELGYWIGEPFWGQGYASEAAGALVSAAMEEGACKTLRAQARAENLASRRVLEKLGFSVLGHYTAESPPHAGAAMVVYGLGRPEANQ